MVAVLVAVALLGLAAVTVLVVALPSTVDLSTTHSASRWGWV